MIDINDYRLVYFNKTKRVIKIWSLVLAFLIIGIIFINKSFKYYDFYLSKGEYRDGGIHIYVSVDDVKKITRNDEMFINDKRFAYKIASISKDNIYSDKNYYREVTLSTTDKNVENEVVEVKIITDEKTLLEYLFETVWR